jgi:HSP20 family protein
MYDHRKFLKEFDELKVRVRHLFEERVSAVYSGGPTSTGEWTPAVDVYETQDRVYLVAEVAGVGLRDIRIEVLGNVLTLKGVRTFGKKGIVSENYHRMEFSYGSFERSFTLPYPVAESGVRAVLKDGVLQVTLPRGDDRKEMKIKIGSG